MQQEYILDTNAYAILFQMPRTEAFARLENRMRQDGTIRFYLPEIVAMEIHSVIGKFRRGGGAASRSECGKHFFENETIRPCANICYNPGRPRMKSKVFKALQKLMTDIENQNGDVQAVLLSTGKKELDFGKKFLQQYSHLYSFGSHDALVAGTVAAAAEAGQKLTLVTSDKGLKALCADRGITVFDPLATYS